VGLLTLQNWGAFENYLTVAWNALIFDYTYLGIPSSGSILTFLRIGFLDSAEKLP
jgi:hypothetical protein